MEVSGGPARTETFGSEVTAMPHLDANALERDPEGLAFLRAVIEKTAGRAAASRDTTPEPPERSEPALRPIINRRHSIATAALGISFRILAFAILIAAIGRGSPVARSSRRGGWPR